MSAKYCNGYRNNMSDMKANQRYRIEKGSAKMRKIKAMVLITMITTILLSQLVSSVDAWCGAVNLYGGRWDVHYDDTKDWCIDSGMSTFWAKKVAVNCDSVDVLFKNNYKWHLDRRRFLGKEEDTRILQAKNEMIIAKRKLKEAAKLTEEYKNTRSTWTKAKLNVKIKLIKEEAAMYLGRSLHPIQDMYAHMDAGVDTPDSKIGNSHGMLNASMVDVKVYYPNGEYEIRQMKLEDQDSNGVIYSIYDDVNYDFVDGEWIFREDMDKEDNTRWVKTGDASLELINEFMEYADELDISFTF